MRQIRYLLLAPAALLAIACSRGADSKQLDQALSNDLALASAAQPYQPQQFVSPMEQGYGMNPYGYNPYNPYAQAPQQYQTMARAPYGYPAPVYTATRPASTVRRTSSGTVAARQAEPVRHTKRDALIGATAGAIIGATSSRNKVQGGLIGAAAGGLLGGIIGHTVDVDH
jgi:Glycine zipper